MIRFLGILVCVLVVACNDRPEDYTIAVTKAAPPIRTCDCISGFWGRELVASICHRGPVGEAAPVRGCVYRRGNKVVMDQPLERHPI
jgi:hypothetical protein